MYFEVVYAGCYNATMAHRVVCIVHKHGICVVSSHIKTMFIVLKFKYQNWPLYGFVDMVFD